MSFSSWTGIICHYSGASVNRTFGNPSFDFRDLVLLIMGRWSVYSSRLQSTWATDFANARFIAAV